MNSHKEIFIRFCKIAHLFLSVLIFAFAWRHYRAAFQIEIAFRYDIFVYAMYGVLMYFFCRTYNAYLIEYQTAGDILFSLCLSSGLSTAGVYILTLIAWNQYYSPKVFLLEFLVQCVLNAVWAAAALRIYYHINRPLSTVVLYRNKNDLKRLDEVRRYEKKYTIVRYMEDPQDIFEATAGIEEAHAEAVFIAGVNATLRNGIAKYCIEKNIPGFFLPHVGDVIISGGQHVQAFSVPVMSIQRSNNPPEYLLIKRLTDIFVSLIAIILAGPFMILTALAVKLQDGGPVLYRQVRLTKDRKEFQILKFRSMRVDAEGDGVARLSTGENDSRITPVGRVIRAIRFDELPQLFNILKGDMTLVGPRPERPELAAEYEKEMPAFSLRLQVKAGLTGYAQVYGKYNTNPYDKLEMDLMYINRMNILLDIQIMFATIRILFKKESTEGIGEGKTNAM